LDTVGGALFEPALRSLRFDGRMIDFQRPRTADRLPLPAVKAWPLENSVEAYQTVLDGSAGTKRPRE
jgi:hypothetical protein